jgi:protein involved in polysaccharide export with SLBB domain
MTVEAARASVRNQVAKFVANPQVALNVVAQNSKVYYVITQGRTAGDSVARMPAVGNDTLADALGQVNGPNRMADKTIFIARPSPAGADTIVKVQWKKSGKRMSTVVDQSILPGDRIFIVDRLGEKDFWRRVRDALQ